MAEPGERQFREIKLANYPGQHKCSFDINLKVVYALSMMKFRNGRPCTPEISVVGTNGKGWTVGRKNGTEGAA
jgi:hypothetical protein